MENIFTDKNFETEVLKSELPVLVDFFAVRCGLCQMIAPIVEEIARETEGRIKVGKLNVDENQETPNKYGVMNIPTLILFKGGQAIKTLAEFRSKEDILQQISDF